MTNILFINITGSTNKGDMTYIIGHVDCIKRYLSDAQITLLSIDTSVDKIYGKYGITVAAHHWYKRDKSRIKSILYSLKGISCDAVSRLFCAIMGILHNERTHFYDQFDVVVEPHADGFNEPYYGFWETLYFSVNLFLAQLIIRKPIIIGPASVGPLTSKLNRWITKIVLNKVTMITVREELSQRYVQQNLKIKCPAVYLVDDLAFLVKPDFTDVVNSILSVAKGGNNRTARLVGIIVNYGMAAWNKPPNYIKLIATVIDYINEKYDFKVLLIPQHNPKFNNKAALNDSAVCQEIFNLVKEKNLAFVLSKEINPEEWKAIIGGCDIAIGCRLHCSIMSTSMGVPTITLSYGRKVNSIIGERMGQFDTLVNIEADNFEHILLDIQKKVDYVWSNRQVIRSVLEDRSKRAEECALTYGTLIQQFVPPRKY